MSSLDQVRYLPIEIANAQVVAAELDSTEVQGTTVIPLPAIVVTPPDTQAINKSLRRGNLIRLAIAIIALAASLAVMNVSNPPPQLTVIGSLSLLLPITTIEEKPTAKNLMRFALGICLIWGSIHASLQLHNLKKDFIAVPLLFGIMVGAIVALPRSYTNPTLRSVNNPPQD